MRTVNRKVGKKNSQIVVQNITIQTPNRKTQDIENWKMAIKQFENIVNPSRTLLYDMYDSIVLDGQIESTWGKRLDNITNKELLYVKDGKEDLEICKILNSPEMREILKELLNSVTWGYTLIQINDIKYNTETEQYEIDWDLIPRKHVHPEKNWQCISKQQGYASRDFLYKEPPLSHYMLWAGNPTNMGLLVKAAQYVIYKRGDFGDWSQYAEVFGMPFREGRYDDYDEETRLKLVQAMQNYGGMNYAILPKNAEFKIHENTSASGSSALYKDLYGACNAEISKTILGNTLTTEQGDKGTQALGTVHKETETDKMKSDEKLITDILNGKFRQILKNFGFKADGGVIWFRSPDTDWDSLQKKWTVINSIANRVPIDDDFIYEEFDIPKPKDYENMKENMRSSSELNLAALENVFKKKHSNYIVDRVLNFFV